MTMSDSYSTRSCSRVRTDSGQRGFVLLSVLLIAVLYFGLIELLMADSTRRMREAQRFRACITANILVENGAELAATRMVELSLNESSAQSADGSMTGTYRRIGETQFVIQATGVSSGLFETSRSVTIQGRIVSSSVTIEGTQHN